MSEATHEIWSAPTAEHALHATVTIPGSKSLSNRYLILAALGRKPVTLVGLLRSRDTELMMNALNALGARCEVDADEETTVTVTPPKNGVFHGDVDVFCGLAGTVMRFVPGLALFADGPVRFDGDEQAYARPMGPVLEGLQQLGAAVEFHGNEGGLPFTITPPQSLPEHARVRIDSSSSSQFISGLLLIASRLPGGLDLQHMGEKLPSMPHIRMTMEDVRMAGGGVTMPERACWHVDEAMLSLPERIVVEPDLSNAAPFLGAAMIAGGTVSVPHWPYTTTQPGGLLPDMLQRMGAMVTLDDVPFAQAVEENADSHASGVLSVTSGGAILGLGRFDMSAAGEIAPSIAALAALADGPSELVGIGHLRGHETNRLEALVTEIRRIGAQAEELADGIRIIPVSRDELHGETMETYADHRMATFAAMIGLVVPGTGVVDVATTRKTIPDFTGMWMAMLGK